MACTAKQIELPHGRSLGYSECGSEKGEPLFFFHGTPGSHFDWELFGDGHIAEQLGIRLIAVDRPGMGNSTFQSGRRFLDWPKDVAALADTLQVERFSVLGYSSGGAYALACALTIPERLKRAGVVSGDGPYNLPGLTNGIDPVALNYLYLSRRTPWLYRQILQIAKWLGRYTPSLFLAIFRAQLPPVDRTIFAQPHIQKALLDTLQESMRFGPRGAQWDTAIMVKPWDFRPEDIAYPVHLWYGESDHSTSPAMGRYLAEAIPNSIAQFYPDEGHLSLLARHTQEILSKLAC
jgi:pimeloyl-ACP methyl ester carboxylesterase